MASTLAPTTRDLDEYRQMRGRMSRFINRLVDDIPKRAWFEVTEALGLDPDGVTANDHVYNIVADCCFFDWFDENRRNVVERYADRHRPRRGSDESIVLDAYLQAEYRILYPQSIVPSAGMYCRDDLNQKELFLIDLALSRNQDFKKVIYAVRTIPFGAYWISTSAGIPVRVNGSKAAVHEFRKMNRDWPDNLSRSVLLIRRFLAGSSGFVVMSYEDPSLTWRDPLRAPRRAAADSLHG